MGLGLACRSFRRIWRVLELRVPRRLFPSRLRTFWLCPPRIFPPGVRPLRLCPRRLPWRLSRRRSQIAGSSHTRRPCLINPISEILWLCPGFPRSTIGAILVDRGRARPLVVRMVWRARSVVSSAPLRLRPVSLILSPAAGRPQGRDEGHPQQIELDLVARIMRCGNAPAASSRPRGARRPNRRGSRCRCSAVPQQLLRAPPVTSARGPCGRMPSSMMMSPTLMP